MSVQRRSIGYAIAAAALYALSAPLSKQLLATVSATMMAALLYLGAGLGMCAGELGFEPIQYESESQVLPLHHSPSASAVFQLRVLL